ncbi:MAG: hypothetical protein KF858_14825, partial [Candidatus Sumerlaeia bacterium]|nr:hypothetical protein [Candidatus Sumerlaeia bacterium]
LVRSAPPVTAPPHLLGQALQRARSEAPNPYEVHRNVVDLSHMFEQRRRQQRAASSRRWLYSAAAACFLIGGGYVAFDLTMRPAAKPAADESGLIALGSAKRAGVEITGFENEGVTAGRPATATVIERVRSHEPTLFASASSEAKPSEVRTRLLAELLRDEIGPVPATATTPERAAGSYRDSMTSLAPPQTRRQVAPAPSSEPALDAQETTIATGDVYRVREGDLFDARGGTATTALAMTFFDTVAPYDPTNATVSGSGIVRFEPSKPAATIAARERNFFIAQTVSAGGVPSQFQFQESVVHVPDVVPVEVRDPQRADVWFGNFGTEPLVGLTLNFPGRAEYQDFLLRVRTQPLDRTGPSQLLDVTRFSAVVDTDQETGHLTLHLRPLPRPAE